MYLLFYEQELRIEDYEVGRKTGAASSTGFTGLPTSTGTGGLFGSTSGTGFGTSSSLIGQKQPTAFGTTGMDWSNAPQGITEGWAFGKLNGCENNFVCLV